MPLSPAAGETKSEMSHTFYMLVRLNGLNGPERHDDRDETPPLPRILIVSGGSGTVRINGRQHPLSRGSVLLCDAGFQPVLQSEPYSLLKGIQLVYRGITADGSPPQILEYDLPLHLGSAGIVRLAEELAAVWREPQLGGPFRPQQLFTELLAELHRELTIREQPEQPANGWFDQALQYMEEHYCEDLTREQMAELAKVSPEHFSRTFRKLTGRTFNTHLTLLRIRSAQRRFLTGAPDLNTLAQEVGYREGCYLSRKFKETAGLSPTAYKRKRKRIAALNPNHTASLIALGVTPELGVYTSWLEQEQLSRSAAIGPKLNPYEMSPDAYMETVSAARPDVIIDYSTGAENRSLLPIAPVVQLPFKTMSWREQFRLIGDIANKRQQAEDWLSRYDERISESNLLLDRELGRRDARGTAIVWEIGPGSAYCIGSSFGRGCQILYGDLGFRLPSRLQEQGIFTRGYVEADIEAIADYSADHIWITDVPADPAVRQRIRRLFRSEGWLNLEAVRRNRVYLLNQSELFYGYDPISSKAQLRELLRTLVPHHKST